jgi:broad specificity phosphatase PhoE
MTTVFVIRHPETTWNKEQRYQGRLDTALSAHGREQAERLVASFSPHTLDAVFTSPLARARVLAEGLGRRTGAAVCVDNRLTEIAQGSWEGMRLKDIRDTYGELYAGWYSRPDLVVFPRGEGLMDVRRRSQALLSDVFERFHGSRIAIVTHSVVVQSFVIAALGLDPRHLHRLHVANCGVTTLCGEEAPGSLFTLNSTEALYGSPAGSAEAAACASFQERKVTT